MFGSRKVLVGGLIAVAMSGAAVGVDAQVGGASTFSVANTNAAGVGSLNQAIINANAHSGADTITFAPNTNGHAIAAPSESPTGDVTFQGNGQGVTIVTGELNIEDSNGTVGVSNLTVGDINANSDGHATTAVVLTNLTVAADGIDLNSGAGASKTTATITNVRVTGSEINVNSDGSTTTATITNSSVQNSNTDGMNVNGSGTSVVMRGSTLSHSNDDGINSDDANLTVVNSTISGSGSDGLNVSGRATLQNVTIAGASGSVIDGFGGSLSLTNTILSGVGGEEGVCDLSNISIASHGGNIASDSSCKLTNAADHPHSDAHLGALAANGGATQTMMPGTGSAAIDGGVASGCPSTDQRGVGRPQDGNGDGIAVCDSGAVEAPGKAPATTTTVAPATTVTAATTPTTAAPGTVAPTSAARVAAAATTQLPRTGSSSAPLGAVGVVLVALGSALGYSRRRRAL